MEFNLYLGMGVALFLLLLIFASLRSRKKLKYISVSLLSVFVILIGILAQSYATEWHREIYVMQGGFYQLGDEIIPATKDYQVAGESIEIFVYPDVEIVEKIHRKHGPYNIAFIFEDDYETNKNIWIYDLKMHSNLGRDFPISENFPIAIEPDWNNLSAVYGYSYDLEKAFDFDFEKAEEITIFLEVGIEKENALERENITLKLVPILDQGKAINFSGV